MNGGATSAGGVAGRAAPVAWSLRVLLAEHNHVNQLVVSKLLRRRVTGADVGDGEKALSALQTGPFDVVLVDAQMRAATARTPRASAWGAGGC